MKRLLWKLLFDQMKIEWEFEDIFFKELDMFERQ